MMWALVGAETVAREEETAKLSGSAVQEGECYSVTRCRRSKSYRFVVSNSLAKGSTVEVPNEKKGCVGTSRAEVEKIVNWSNRPDSGFRISAAVRDLASLLPCGSKDRPLIVKLPCGSKA